MKNPVMLNAFKSIPADKSDTPVGQMIMASLQRMYHEQRAKHNRKMRGKNGK